MATYKVIQDIEAEDKLLGPLSLRQFIYAVIVVLQLFLGYKLLPISPFFIVPMLPTIILFTVLAAPFGRDQPSEVWLLAKIRFFLKPRNRIWDQSGLKQLVTITVPKRPEKHFTNNLSQTEVHSRLRALADTIDSRGWAVKNVNVNLNSEPSYAATGWGSDRLVDASSLPQEVPSYEVTASDDIMDARNNPVAQQLDQMMMASAQAHRKQVVQQMQQPAAAPASNPAPTPTNDYWFLNQPDPMQLPDPGYVTFGAQTISPGTPLPETAAYGYADPSEEAAIAQQLHTQQSNSPAASFAHMKVINPLGQAESQPLSSANPQSTDAAQQVADDNAVNADNRLQTTSGTPANPAILNLANNNDLNVATLQREANRSTKKHPPNDEVVISLR